MKTKKFLVSYPQRALRPVKRKTEEGIRKDMLAAAQQVGVTLEFLDHLEFCRHSYTPQELDVAFRRNDPSLAALYAHVSQRAREVDAFLVVDMNVYHPDFLERLPLFKSFFSIDDPDSSFLRSMPYAYAFDSVFTVTPRYNRERSMTDQYRRWGCPRAYFVPLGAISSEYGDLDEAAVCSAVRTVPSVFVGTATTPDRLERLAGLRKALGSDFHILGDWTPRTMLKVSLQHRLRMVVRPCVDKTALYRRSQIGINIHDSSDYGFGNRRVFELPINGVLQICDFRSTDLGEFFELDKEVVGYESTAEAIELIRYYLKHSDQRAEIALNGFRRAKRQYLFKDLFGGVLRTLSADQSAAVPS